MPYVKQEVRQHLTCTPLSEMEIETPGELNFVLTRVIMQYTNRWGIRYEQINDILGALEGAKLEFYRRVAAPYENTKIEENGDVY